MKKLIISCLLLATAALSVVAADAEGELKPGRFVLITTGGGLPAPLIVNISKSESGVLEATLEDRPEIGAEIKKSENAYVFSLVIPGDRGVPPVGMDSPQRYYLTYAGEFSGESREVLRGVCTQLFTYHHSGNAPQAATGSFVLFSIDKAEKSKSANP